MTLPSWVRRVLECRVWRGCRVAGIQSAIAKRKSRYKKADAPLHDDLVQRQCTVEGPNALWLTDITEHRAREGEGVSVRDEGCVLQPDRG